MIAGELALNRRAPLSRFQIARGILIAASFAVALAFVLLYQEFPEAVRLEAGQVSPRTILAPDRVTYASEIQTREARSKAEAEIKQVFDAPSIDFAREQVRYASRVLDFVDSLRHDPFSEPDKQIESVRAIPSLSLSTEILTRTLALDENSFHRVVTETLYVLDVTMREEIRPNGVSVEFSKIPSRVSLALPADHAEIATQWVRAFIVPNSFYNEEKTNGLRAQARARVGTVYRTFEKGEAVLREGEIISPLAIETMEVLGVLRPRRTFADFAGPASFAALLVILLSAYLTRLRPGLMAYWRAQLLIVFLVLVFSIAVKPLMDDRTALIYLFPISAAAMLLTALIDFQVAGGVALALALISGYLGNNSLELAMYMLAGGLIAALSLGHIERLPAFLWSGVYVSLTNVAVLTIFRVTARDLNFSAWGQAALAALGNGALSALVALGSLFILGRIFGITTSLELLDLARPTHPLLQKLLMDAPGTYHHCLIVSQLAEQAAQRIGADTLLVRVAAYYHDVGKTGEPVAFVENQRDGINVHDTLDPKASAALVIDHVARGISLAKKYGLPPRVRDIIPQHHGTTLAAYFHHKAQTHNGSQVNESDFRYPGPKPQSREAALIMLADGVEATTRAEHPTSPEQIRVIIERIVEERLRDGQLDETDLTLHDLQQIKEAFLGVLQGQFHPRVKYPERKSVISSQPSDISNR